MKKTLLFVLALALVLTMSVVVFAESAPEDEEIITEAEAVEEPAEEPVADPAEEAIEEPAEEPVEEAVEEIAAEETTDADPIADWMACYNPSWGVSENEWLFCYILNDLRQGWVETEPEELPIMTYQNIGTEDITLSFYYDYTAYIPLPVDFDWSTYDPDTTPPHEVVGRDIVTVVIPAGETVYVPLNEELWAISDGCHGANLWASRGDLTVTLED